MSAAELRDRCPHCGNMTVLRVRAAVPVDEELLDELGLWRVLQCASCGKPILEEAGVDYDYPDGRPWRTISRGSMLYPEVGAGLGGLPTLVQQQYLALLRVRGVDPSACAVMAGKTLEAVCHDRRASGRNLADKLSDLAGRGEMPPTLATMADQLRHIRNLGAHVSSDELTEEDVPVIVDFVEAILEYVYRAPAKIAAVSARLGRPSGEA